MFFSNTAVGRALPLYNGLIVTMLASTSFLLPSGIHLHQHHSNTLPLSRVFLMKLLYLRKNSTAVLQPGGPSGCKLVIQPRDLDARARKAGSQGRIFNLRELVFGPFMAQTVNAEKAQGLCKSV